jgi:hypothetical protein
MLRREVLCGFRITDTGFRKLRRIEMSAIPFPELIVGVRWNERRYLYRLYVLDPPVLPILRGFDANSVSYFVT